LPNLDGQFSLPFAMGKNFFAIDDAAAHFGRELPKRNADPLRLHLAMSSEGSRQLHDAVLAASDRAKASVIECVCRIDERDRSRRRSYRPYSTMRWILRAMEDETETSFDESTEPPTLRWNRRDQSKLVEICERLVAGNHDRHVSINGALDVWVWGNGARF
jgi:hypothetical protein